MLIPHINTAAIKAFILLKEKKRKENKNGSKPIYTTRKRVRALVWKRTVSFVS